MKGAGAIALLVLAGCGRCGEDEPRVPFGLRDNNKPETQDRPADGGLSAAARLHGEALVFASGSSTLELHGQEFAEPKGWKVHAAYRFDGNGDGRQEAYALEASERGEVQLNLVLVPGRTRTERVPLAKAEAYPSTYLLRPPVLPAARSHNDPTKTYLNSCPVTHPEVQSCGEGHLVFAWRCGESGPRTEEVWLWWLRLGARPRVLSTVRLEASRSRIDGSLGLASLQCPFSEPDSTSQAHPIARPSEGKTTASADAPAKSKPIATESTRDWDLDPEAERVARLNLRISAWGSVLDAPVDLRFEQGRLRVVPDATLAALRSAARAGHAAFLDGYRQLCRATGASRFVLSSQRGLDCDLADEASRAAGRRLAYLLSEGRLEEAAHWAAVLDGEGLRPQGAALASAPGDPELVQRTLREGIALAPVAGTTAAPRLVYESPTELRVDTAAARLFVDSDSGEDLRRAPLPPERRWTAPDGRTVLTALKSQSCAATLTLRRLITPASAGRAALLGASRRVEATLAPSLDERPRCASSAAPYAVLAWDNDTIWLARGLDLVRVWGLGRGQAARGERWPLDKALRLRGGHSAAQLSRDGAAQLIPSPAGPVLLRRQKPLPNLRLLRPAAWSSTAGAVQEVALAPDKKQVAVIRGTALIVIESAPESPETS